MKHILFAFLTLITSEISAQMTADVRHRMDTLHQYALDESNPLEERMRSFHDCTRTVVYAETSLGIEIGIDYLKAAQKNDLPLRQIYAYHFIGTGYLLTGKLDESLKYHKKGLDLSKDQGDYNREAEALADIGLVYSAKGELDKSLLYQQKCLGVSKTHDLKSSWARALINIGEIKEQQGDYKASLQSFEEALKLCTQYNFTGFYPAIYAKLGSVNLSIKEYQTAENYFELSLDWAISVNNTGKRIQALEKLGQLHQELDQDKKAMQHYSHAIELAGGTELSVHLARVKLRVASIEIKRNELRQARITVDKSIQLFKQNNVVDDLDHAYILSGEIYYKEDELSRSQIHLKKGYDLAKKSNNIKALLTASYYLFELHKKHGNSTLSLQYYEEYNLLKDIKRDDEDLKKLLKMELNREFRQKKFTDSVNKAKEFELINKTHQQEKEQQEMKTVVAYSGLGVLSLLFAIGGYLFVQKRRSNRLLNEKNVLIEEALKDKGILLKEVHHRVKNNMQVVSSLLYLKSKSTSDDGAKEALMDSQARIKSMQIAHQKMYQNDNYEEINCVEYCKEILSLLITSDIQASGHFEVLGEDLLIEVEKAQAIGFIIHELITNSLKYAWKDSVKKSIWIEFKEINDTVELAYRDNGKGLPDNFKPEESKSFGLNMIHSIVNRQLMGELKMNNNNGFEARIKFRKK